MSAAAHHTQQGNQYIGRSLMQHWRTDIVGNQHVEAGAGDTLVTSRLTFYSASVVNVFCYYLLFFIVIIFIIMSIILSVLSNPVCDEDDGLWWFCIVAKRSQDGETDVVPSIRERARVWYWYDWLRRRPVVLLVSSLLTRTLLTDFSILADRLQLFC